MTSLRKSTARRTRLQPSFTVQLLCRKSTDENLDSAFNSLDAQREACIAYITSQKHAGWVPFSRPSRMLLFRGTLERPALNRLRKEIEAGHISASWSTEPTASAAGSSTSCSCRTLRQARRLLRLGDEQFNTATRAGGSINTCFSASLSTSASDRRADPGQGPRGPRKGSSRRKSRPRYDCDPRVDGWS